MIQPTMPSPTVCDRARAAKDLRFDGLFFTAVRSTRIYCRPVCPAPTPKKSNVSYFPTAAAAASAGYRPCLRCRPELTPATSWGGEDTVQRALSLIAEGPLDADLAAVHSVLCDEPLLATGIWRRPGLRVPGGWDGFEVAVRAVLGQQISVAGATTLAQRLVHVYGEVRIDGPVGLDRCFPKPERFIGAALEKIGLPKASAESPRRVSCGRLGIATSLGLRHAIEPA